MPLLLNSTHNDASTDGVLDWLYFLYPGQKNIRLNDRVEIDQLSYEISKGKESALIGFNGHQLLDTGSLEKYWYRRGHFSFSRQLQQSGYHYLGAYANRYIEREMNFISDAIDHMLQHQCEGINKSQDNNTNKIHNLSLAVQSGLSIPHTLICSGWDKLESFVRQYRRIITKPIGFPSFDTAAGDTDTTVYFKVQLIGLEDILYLKEQTKGRSFLPSLFQQYIDKEFELRIFYLNGQCFAMAIFSQANPQTRTDFRNYDYERPNRYVPYRLPEDLSAGIDSFMKKAGLNCGSIDMIYSVQQEYVFLEINPVGQYQWLSHHCNYFIDRHIAAALNTLT